MELKSLWHGTPKAYTIGFLGSLLLTCLSFFLVATKAFGPRTLIIAIAISALFQAILQILCFLHLGKESKPQWETYVFYFMLLVLFIIVAGSLWIMSDLGERVMNMSMEMTHD